MTDLFNVPETLSPRLAWMREHDIHSHYDDKYEETPWIAYKGEFQPASPHAFGMDLNEAIDALAARLNIKPWRS